MKIISGGQTGVDRAALDVAIVHGLPWGGWCPKGGWAEDATEPPGVLPRYPHLKETPLSHPLQRTEWNVRDSDAALIVTDREGLVPSIGTRRAKEWAIQHGKPLLIVDTSDATAPARAAAWVRLQRKRFGPDLTLSIGGPRESESPGIYERTKRLVAAMLKRLEDSAQGKRQ
jgi:hypothetical protein